MKMKYSEEVKPNEEKVLDYLNNKISTFVSYLNSESVKF